ncbi:MAG: ATP-dependent helicase [Candidatus Marinimicrobia bacterium]|nr:ATP-dependent helicase [Candidatus Neomarinimicrobiota bacterium]
MSYRYPDFHPVQEQQTAITHPPGPLLIIAGAGTGKTATLLHRIRYQVITKQMNPENILILTFTEKATNELITRISDLDIPNSKHITISTFHSFCYNIVQNYVNPENHKTSLMERHDIAFMILNRINELTFLRSRQFRLHPRDAIENAFIPFFNRVRDELISPSELSLLIDKSNFTVDSVHKIFPGLSPKADPDEALKQLRDLIDVYTIFQTWKHESNVVDYGDMIQQCWESLKDPTVLQQVREKYKHIIVDEFQDNNYALNKIVNHIVKPNPSLTVVGDEDQCIYSFRGANYYNIHDFRNKYRNHPQFKEVALETNFRSTQSILDLANSSISNDPERTKKQLKAFQPDHLGQKPTWLIGNSEEYLIEMKYQIVQFIKSGYSYEDIAILCRTTKHVNKAAKFFEYNEIPVQVFRDKFSGIPEIKLFTAWQLVLVDSAKFPIAWSFLVKTYTDILNNRTLTLDFKAISDFDLLEIENPQLEKLISTIQELIRKLNQNVHPHEMVWNILEATDILKESRKYYRYKDRLALRNIGHILIQASQFRTSYPDAQYKDWLLYFDLLFGHVNNSAIEPESNSNGYGVQLMTVHKSKGLEFPIVFLPYLQSASFPLNFRPDIFVNTLPEPWFKWSPESGYDPRLEQINEERRIFYVALTRTKELLFICAHNKRLSRFMKELESSDDNLIVQYHVNRNEDELMNTSQMDTKQFLLAELTREIGLNNWDNATSLLNGIKQIEKDGKIVDENPYSYLNAQLSDVDNISNFDSITLSASAVEEYRQCPYKYRLSKIDRIPQKKSNAQMSFGTIMHQILNEFHKNSENQSKDMLYNLLEKFWNSDAFEYKLREEEFYKQAQEIIEEYWAYLPKLSTTFLAGEVDFSFSLDDANIQIKGKIDRIDKSGDTLCVIDYKTSNKPANDTTKQSLQLALYIEAINRGAITGLAGKPGNAQLLYLKDLAELYNPHKFTDAELDKHLETVYNAAQGIRNHKFPQNPSDYTCKNCDYKDFLCPAWEND